MKGDWVGRWKGQTVVCIASGPSLTEADCELVRRSGHPTIATKMNYLLCPWADVLFGMDCNFWSHYGRDIDKRFKGAKLTLSHAAKKFGATTFYGQPWFTGFGNSGTCAVSLAVVGGASTVILIGFDCQKTGGKVHWHGDHPKGFGNGRSMPTWSAKFAKVGAYAKKNGCRVVNASRETALKCFDRMDLETALDTYRSVREDLQEAA